MTGRAGLSIREVEMADDDAALALERRCPQGQAFRIVFDRDSFRRRTESFAEAHLVGAWRDGRLLAVGGGAIKDVRWEGRSTRMLMLYDFRVDPTMRREGLARMLTETLIDWARPRAEIGIAYSLGDNRAIQAMAREAFGADTAPAFDLLAYPTAGKRSQAGSLVEAPAAEVHYAFLQSREAPDLVCDASEALSSSQRIGSWQLEGNGRAGCSAWSTAGILEEVVVGLPPALRAASWIFGGNPARILGWPHVPRLNETLRSWLVFDASADDERAARNMVAAVAAQGRAQGVDHCHVVLPPGSSWGPALRRDVPSAFAPILPFSIMARTIDGKPLRLAGPVIDPRDI